MRRISFAAVPYVLSVDLELMCFTLYGATTRTVTFLSFYALITTLVTSNSYTRKRSDLPTDSSSYTKTLGLSRCLPWLRIRHRLAYLIGFPRKRVLIVPEGS